MANTKHRLAKHGSIYFLGNILQRAVSFIMLPIYTRYLTPADYGILELLSMTIDFVALIFGMQVADAIFRYYAKYDEEKDKNEVVSSALFLVATLNTAGMLLVWTAAEPLSNFIFGNPENSRLLILFSVTLVTQSTIAVPLVFLRAMERSLTFLTFSVTKLAMQLGLNIYFVVILGMKVEGVIYGALITGVVMSLLLSAYTLRFTGIRWSLTKSREIVRFSIPLIGAGLLSFYFTFGDRFFLRLYSGVEAVGIYSLAYKFGFLLTFLVVGPFNNIWKAEMYHVAKKENAVRIFQDAFLVLSTFLIFFAVGISVFIRELLMIMSAPEFWSAAQIVPVIMAAYVFQAWTWYGSFGVLFKERTIERTYGNLLAVIVITPGYLLLIPLYGPMGAALATLVAFAARCAYLNWRGNSLFNLHLPWRRMALAGLLSMGAVSASWWGPDNLVYAIVYNILVMSIFCALFLFLPVLPPHIRHSFFNLITKPRTLVTYFK